MLKVIIECYIMNTTDVNKVPLTCGSKNDFDPLLHCPICGKGETSKRKLTSTENGCNKIRNVSTFCSNVWM